jgi:hypothetical protein
MEPTELELLKTVMLADIEAFAMQAAGYEAKAKLVLDPNEAKELVGLASILGLHASVIDHYLGVIEEIQNREVVNDGGSEPNQTTARSETVRKKALAPNLRKFIRGQCFFFTQTLSCRKSIWR